MPSFNLNNVVRKTTSTGKELIKCDARDNNGNVTHVTIWKLDKDNKVFPGFDTIANGSIIEGNLWNKAGTSDWTLYPPKERKFGGMGTGLIQAKARSIQEAQTHKEQSIGKAQDRNEVMYAKKSAAELIANHPAYKGLNELNLPAVFQNLTRLIYNFNPNTNLDAVELDDITNTKVAMHQAHEELDEIDASNIPF